MKKNNDNGQITLLKRAYKYNSTVALLILINTVLAILLMTSVIPHNSISTGISLAVPIFAILAHINTRKLKLKNVGPILIYVANLLGLPLIFWVIVKPGIIMTLAFKEIKALFIIATFLLQIIAAIFCYRQAKKIKKQIFEEDEKEFSSKDATK
ncbi:MAG: hypothetical protein LBI13_03890 [Streptococcaceae bacterium]|jgi:hypothetical protein|nr:hypothetical protein [Streptococcaceae bacterium]